MSESTEQLAREVSREFYERYEAMAAPIAYKIKNQFVNLYGGDENHLRELFLKDKHLNNIPMMPSLTYSRPCIDNYYHLIRLSTGKNLALSESCCLIKHILIYHVLKVKPILI